MTPASHAGRTVRTSDMRFAFHLQGRPGQAVVLLHGWPQTSRAWHRVAPLLAKDFDVVVPDLPGFGDTSKPERGFDKRTVARRLREFVLALGLSRVALVGHDLGGHVAYAAQWPDEVSHLIFVESSLPAFGQEEAMDVSRGGSWHFGFNMAGDISEALVQGRKRPFVEHFVRCETVGLVDNNSISTDDIEHYARALARRGVLRCSLSYYRTLPTDRADNRAWGETKLTMPVLAIGADGGYGPASAQTMRRVATNVRDMLIERSGHYIPEQQPGEMARTILGFIKQNPSAPRRASSWPITGVSNE